MPIVNAKTLDKVHNLKVHCSILPKAGKFFPFCLNVPHLSKEEQSFLIDRKTPYQHGADIELCKELVFVVSNTSKGQCCNHVSV